MGKTQVYSWRVSPGTKAALEYEARRAGKSLGALLDDIAAAWLLGRHGTDGEDAEEQARLHRAVARTAGAIAGGDPSRSSRARLLIRRRIARRRAS